MRIWTDTLYAHIEDLVVAEIHKLRYQLILATRDKAELGVLVIDSHRIRIKLVVLLAYKMQRCADLKVTKCLTAVPECKTCNVEIAQVLVNSFFGKKREKSLL